MLLGIRCLRRGSERLFGARLRQLLQAATQSRWRALLAGFCISILTPSSTAVALLAVEAITGGFMTFQQVLAMMLGANIGFTLTVQLLAFKFYVYYGVFLVLGIPPYVFSRRIQWRGGGQALMGVGFLLLAIQVISNAVAPLKNDPDVVRIVEVLGNHPLWLLVFSAGLKVILQSATAAIGLAMALTAQGVLPVPAAVVVVIGANIGIGVTALLAGFTRTDTRRMAVGNLIFKLVGAVVCLPVLGGLIGWLTSVSGGGDTQLIANSHTLFNIALAIIFLPLLPWLARVLEKVIPTSALATEKPGAHYLDAASLESPALALGQATREILHMADHVRQMLRDARQALAAGDAALCAAVKQQDDAVDLLNTEIKTYIVKLAEQDRGGLTHTESRREIALLGFANELESIGDIVEKNLIELVEKKIKLQVEFSDAGRTELDQFFQEVLANFELAVAAFATQDRVLAEQLLQHKQQINAEELELRNRHFNRLRSGLVLTFETSAIHLDLLTYLKYINSHLTAVAYPILETKSA